MHWFSLISLVFLSTLSLRRATEQSASYNAYLEISIHALLAESDLAYPDMIICTNVISIHALLAESDGIGLVFMWWGVRFLSTLSLRRATRIISIINNIVDNFYPRSPCGERPTDMRQRLIEFRFLSTLSLRRATAFLCFVALKAPISIHALLAESDINKRCKFGRDNGFLSTLSLRRATLNGFAIRWKTCISIHALLAESDAVMDNIVFVPREFLSTLSLRRATRNEKKALARVLPFLSTLSLRRATELDTLANNPPFISIHALLAESDAPRTGLTCGDGQFLSTLSLRRATFYGS